MRQIAPSRPQSPDRFAGSVGGHHDERLHALRTHFCVLRQKVDFGNFEGFWRRLAGSRLRNVDGLAEGIRVETILKRALEQWPTCTLCDLLLARVFDLSAAWQAVLAKDSAERAEFLERQTWCNRHAWIYAGMAGPRELGSLQRELHAELARQLAALADHPGSVAGATPQTVLDALSGQRVCPLCQDELALETLLLEALACGLKSGSLRVAFAASAGCCLPHLAALLASADAETTGFVAEAASRQAGRLVTQLDFYEAERRALRHPGGAAAKAFLRAMGAWVGQRGTIRPGYDERLELHGGIGPRTSGAVRLA